MRASPSRFRLGLAWVGVVIAGLGAGAWTMSKERNRRLEDLRVDAQRCALAFESEQVAQLTGTRSDMGSPIYSRVKERLSQLHAVHPDVRFVSLFRVLPDQRGVIYLADSEPNLSREVSLPGDVFPEAPRMPGLQSIMRDGLPSTEGPIEDSFGVFVTGYAQIGAPRKTEAGEVREVVALDVAARYWNGELLDAAAKGALYTWLLLGAPLGILTLRSRQSRRDALIEKLSHAVEQSHSGILITSPEGRIEFVNEGLCSQLGLSEAELIGRGCSEFQRSKVPAALLAEMLHQVLRGESWEGEWQNCRKDGTLYPCQAVVTPVKNERSQTLGYIAVLSDLTGHYQQQEELRRAKERAEAGDRAKGEFLATMSHEVRTPLNGIVGFTNLLLETPLTVEQREYVQTIRTSGEALVQLTGDILDYSRIESGGLQLDASICDVRATVEDALDLFAGRAGEKGVELLHWIEPDVPVQMVLDCGRLRQVLVNLIGNAVKFTGAGWVEVSVRNLTARGASMAPFDPALSAGQLVAELDDGSLTLEFSVRDTGIGIAAEDRPKLFQPFTQLDVSTVRRYGGAGLGLAISRNLVRLMGGEIWIESDPGKGSTFFFTLRGRRAPADVQVSQACDLAGCRLALIGGAPALRTELVRVLRDGAAVVTEHKLAELDQAVYDLALIDCSEDVIINVDTLVKSPGWRDGRVFGLVTVAVSSQDRQSLRPHVRMLLNKPVHHRTLLDILSRTWAKLRERARTENTS
jgi:PAS domain S-box-containing protein